MDDRYEPPSDFLNAIRNDDVSFTEGEFADANLRRLIAMTRDSELANRDWATFLLALEDIDTPLVRETLLSVAHENDDIVRDEAVWGLAQRDPALALPFVQAALASDRVTVPMLDAAALCPHPSLIEDLQVWAEPSEDPWIDEKAAEALAACLAVKAKTD